MSEQDGTVDAVQGADEKFSLKSFAQGMVAVALIYAALGGWLWLGSDRLQEAQNSRLSSKTVPVQWGEQGGNAGNHAVEEGSDLPLDASLMEDGGLTEAPLEGLTEETSTGKIPLVRKDGMTSFNAYRRPFDKSSAANKPVIALVISDLGLSGQATESALRDMPPEVTFALSPYASSPDLWAKESRARGHEIWMTLPLETMNYPQTDPGPHTLTMGVPERDNMEKLSWLMSRAGGYVGFITDRNTAFVNSVGDMRPIVGTIYNRGLAFADNAENASAVPATVAHGMNAPYAAIDVWVDETATQESIRSSLELLEKKARERGAAAGLIHPLPVSYQEVIRWIATLNDKGFVIAPLSAQTGL